MVDTSREYAVQQDKQDPLHHLRDFFVFPTKGQLHRDTLEKPATNGSHAASADEDEPCLYFCGNSLGLQPTLTRKYLDQYLNTWGGKGVHGHFSKLTDSNLAPWGDMDENLAKDMARLFGAKESEVAVMNTLTGNLHLMLCSFYRPNKDRYKIIIEGKAFPSDHFAVESQIRVNGLDPADAMILIQPPNKQEGYLPTEHILNIIDQHAKDTAVLLLPGIQFYSGQFLDMPRITEHAQARGITVGWDLAHAAGNVPVQLHDWNVDFAVWCTYKYMNSGPGSMGGAFVHERHTTVGSNSSVVNGRSITPYRPRLAGWYGSSKATRFNMSNEFEPMEGAKGFQLANPSAADTTTVRASLDIFNKTSISDLRAKSLKITAYLESLLDHLAESQKSSLPTKEAAFRIITPRDPNARGAQLSVLLNPGLLPTVMARLEAEGVVLDERKPDVIRVAPAPLYNSWEDVWRFIEVFGRACEEAVAKKAKQ